MTSLKTSIKTITYLSDIGCLEIQGASLLNKKYIPPLRFIKAYVSRCHHEKSHSIYAIFITRSDVWRLIKPTEKTYC
ncbi:hypothetical protein B6Q94_25930 [Escherichia coli]|nr:hypothetical protein [Escherichia coli]EFO2523682.1 hypothetical protein [Escherichia coli]EFO2698366.1 hypothetical protein [Escherichia coli]